jgi:hypothetical protein
MADDLLFVYRPLSQILQIAVLPDIHARVANGSLDRTSLPLELHQFRWISGAQGSLVEVNNQFQVPIMVTAKRPMKAGEAVTLADIDPEACALAPAMQGGRLAAYFVYIRQFLNVLVLFDFSANNPFGGADDQPVPLRFPLKDYLSTGQLLQSHPPLDILAKLEARNWPPAPAYYPSAIPYLSQTDDNGLEDAITDVYKQEYWQPWTTMWREVGLFRNRLTYIEKALERYFQKDFVSAIYVLVPQFEGIVRDYLRLANVEPKYRFESCLEQLRTLLMSRDVILFPRGMLELIVGYMQDGPFLTETAQIRDPANEVNRHGIAHGVFVGFENQTIALKYLALLDGLAFILLQDRVVASTL